MPVAYGWLLLPGSCTDTGTEVKKEADEALQRLRTFDHPSSETKFIPEIALLMGR